MIKVETNEQYHAEKEHISNTALKSMRKSPAHFFEAFAHPKDDEATSAQKKGTLIHELLLLQDISKYVRRPVDKDGKQINGTTTVYKEWLKTLKPEQEPCEAELFDNLYKALTAFSKHQRAMALYDGAQIEKSIYTKCPHTGLLIKAKPDIWGKNYVADLKSAGSDIDAIYPQEIYKKGYDFQLAHYGETAEAEAGDKILHHYIIAFEEVAPFGIKVFEIPQAQIEAAKERRLGYLNTIKVCQAENNWPAYSDEIVIAEKPKYLDKKESSVFDEVG